MRGLGVGSRAFRRNLSGSIMSRPNNIVPRPGQAERPKLLHLVRRAIRARHYSPRTEEAYVAWVRRFVRFHDTRHPLDLGEPEITQFLTSLATDRRVSASTQQRALSALLFLYRDVLQCDVGRLDGLVRPRTPQTSAGGAHASGGEGRARTAARCVPAGGNPFVRERTSPARVPHPANQGH